MYSLWGIVFYIRNILLGSTTKNATKFGICRSLALLPQLQGSGFKISGLGGLGFGA